MKDRDEWKAAFWTNRGLYKPLVMFFGLTNSLATFQTMMDAIFEDLISEGVVVVYLDDILIFTKTLEEHQKVVRRVMEVLQKYGLSLKPEKCEFERTSVEYLGVVVSHDSVKMDPAKVAGVSELSGDSLFTQPLTSAHSTLPYILDNSNPNSDPFSVTLRDIPSRTPYIPLFYFPLFLVVYNLGLILAEESSYSFRTSC